MYFTKPFNKNLKSGKGFSEVSGIRFQSEFSDVNRFCRLHKLSMFDSAKLKLKLVLVYALNIFRIKKSIWLKQKLFIGPFVGEFGNFLGHALPFISFLHKKGIEVHFCGLELFRPFLIDYNGNEIVNFYGLRDVYNTTKVSTNSGEMPKDVQKEMALFYQKAAREGVLIDLRNDFFYYFVFRDFVAKGRAFNYNIKKNFQLSAKKTDRSCVLFPRAKGAAETKNNGKEWDYNEVVHVLAECFDKIYVLGHPAFVRGVNPHPKVETKFSTDNKELIQICSNVDCIVSQHSGVIYLCTLFEVPYVMLYGGGTSPADIGSFNNSLYFLNSVKKPYQIEFCYYLNNLKPIIAQILKDKQ